MSPDLESIISDTTTLKFSLVDIVMKLLKSDTCNDCLKCCDCPIQVECDSLWATYKAVDKKLNELESRQRRS